MNATQPTRERIDVGCCIVGGGPAGMMLGYLLARAGVSALVLEKHGDFLRDFRGDTVHPSTLDVLFELGLLERFLARPHQKVQAIRGSVGGQEITLAEFGHTPTHCHFLVLMPQWDFLDFLAEEGGRYDHLRIRKNAEVVDLVQRNGRVAGVLAETTEGPLEVRADLVVGADGRDSILRARAGLRVDELGVPIDVIWTKLSRRNQDPPSTLGYFDFGRVLVLLDRGEYWQAGLAIRKGELEELRARGLPVLRQELVRLAPFLIDRVAEIDHWDAVKLLTVRVDRLQRWWRPGLLCIGDCAHAMSPIGGVGINLAIQDAVAAANILAAPLRTRWVTDELLQAVQRRRMLPTRVTQGIQTFIQDRIWPHGARREGHVETPGSLRLLDRWPLLQRIPARLIGVGVRPEHVAGRPAAHAPS